MDKALIEIKNDGTLAEILTKYFGKDTSPADDDLKATPNKEIRRKESGILWKYTE